MINIVLEIVLVSGLLYGYYALFLRNKSFHSFNRAYLVISLVLSASIPFLHIPVENDFVSDFTQTSHTISGYISTNELSVSQTLQPAVSSGAAGITLQQFFYVVYFFIAFILFSRIVIALIRVARLLAKYGTESREGILIVKTTEKDAPFSFYKWLFWNTAIDMDSAIGTQIIKHETVHLRQGHTADSLFAEILFSLCWINPFFYLIKKELKAVHEFLADGIIIQNSDKVTFANLLLMQAMGTQTALGHNFFGSITRRRIDMLSRITNRKFNSLQKIITILLASGTLLLFSFDAVKSSISEHTIIPSQKKFNTSNAKPVAKDKNVNAPEAKVNDAASVNNDKPDDNGKIISNRNNSSVLGADSGQQNVFIERNEISFLNYQDEGILYSNSMPANNMIPAFVKTRSPQTQMIFSGLTGKEEALFFPPKQYNEMVLIFNKNKDNPLGEEWRLKVNISNENGSLVKSEILKPEWITGFEVVKIFFDKLPEGEYHLQLTSSDNMYSSSCKVIKDYD